MNETPTGENGIWFLVKEFGVLLFPFRVGPESLQMQLGPHSTRISAVPPRKDICALNDGGSPSSLFVACQKSLSD